MLEPGVMRATSACGRRGHAEAERIALASLNLTRRNVLPTLTATLATIAFDDSSLQRFEART